MSKIIMILIGSAMLVACEDTEVTQSGEEFLREIAVETCETGAVCGLLDRTVGQCVDFIADTFCTQLPGQCSVDYTVPVKEYDACIQALRDRNCQQVANGAVPGACLVSDLNQISIFY